MNKNRYYDLAKRKGNNVAKAHYKKSCYHESLHVLHSKFKYGKEGFYSNDESFFKRKVELFDIKHFWTQRIGYENSIENR